MELNFPANPSLGQRYSYGDHTWRWNGIGWKKFLSSSINDATGILYGGILTAVTGGSTFDISAGIGQIVGFTGSLNGVVAGLSYITWQKFSGITVNNIGSQQFTYIYIDGNSNLQQSNTPFSDLDYDNYVVIGALAHTDNTTINLVTNTQEVAYKLPHRFTDLLRVFGPMKKSGLVVSANGANLRLNRTSGTLYRIGSNYTENQFDSEVKTVVSANPANLWRVYRNGTGGYVFDTNSNTFYANIDATKYDNNSGTLQTVNNNQWTIQRMYMFPNNHGTIITYYGPAVYNSQTEATAAISTETFTEATITAENAVFLGFMIVRGGASNLSSTSDVKFIQSGFSRTVSVGGGGGAGAGASVLDDLNDVAISGVSGGDVLYYDSGSSLWINKPFNEINIDGGLY